VSSAPAIASDAYTRQAGADRYATSAIVSEQTFAPGAEVAYVASGRDFPDALAGAAAAGASDAPVLLVPGPGITPGVRAELDRLDPRSIAVLGGESAVSSAVVDDLDRYTSGPVTRLHGADRYATSAAVSEATFDPGADVAYVASGRGFPDALAGAAAAGATGSPVLLVPGPDITEPVRAELARLRPARIVVLGGEASVSAGVEQQLGSFTRGGVVRLSGEDRYATSASVAAALFGPRVPTVYLASGRGFPDALAGAAAAGASGSPVLLVPGAGIPAAVRERLAELRPGRVVVLGGSAVVPDATGRDAARLASGELPAQPPAPPPAPAPAPAPAVTEYDRRMVELINAERAKAGVPALTSWAPLRTGAAAHSRWMLDSRLFQHATADNLRADVFAAGCGSSWGENIYTSWGHPADPAIAITGYMNSPGHRANILNPGYRYVATGTVVDGKDVRNTQRFAGTCS
ncbi:hypothetical protein GB882_02915, partial [Georgenia ruanii]|nr:hypothetical protein [Georgenia ruanii]